MNFEAAIFDLDGTLLNSMDIWEYIDIEFQTYCSNFLTIMYDIKEEVQRAYEIMKEGSKELLINYS